jgi:hypothetical protein
MLGIEAEGRRVGKCSRAIGCWSPSAFQTSGMNDKAETVEYAQSELQHGTKSMWQSSTFKLSSDIRRNSNLLQMISFITVDGRAKGYIPFCSGAVIPQGC